MKCLKDVWTLELDSIICNADSVVRSKSRKSTLGCGAPDARDVVEPYQLFGAICISFEPISFLGKELRCPVHLRSPQQVRDAFGSLELLPVCALGAGRSHPPSPQGMHCSRRLNGNVVAGARLELT